MLWLQENVLKIEKTSKLAALIDSCLYKTLKYVKVYDIMKRFVLVMILAI